ncbi:MAG TPA: ATP-binding protein [Pyrinomonadaceae bacterium]|nr:ATP-binding protein [Pyrinomonadaceae bacterium]
MGIENFITDALYKPNDYISYHVGRELAELHPGKAIIKGETGYFDLEAFVRAEKCSVVHETSIFNHLKTSWDGPGKEPIRAIENSWLNVLWHGELLDVILITFSEDRYRSRHHWIVAESRRLAEDFFADVCEWSAEVRGEVLVFRDGEWVKNKELYDAIKTATFDNLILREPLKQEIQNDFAQFFSSREVYERYRIPWKRGVLFIGPPGNGKTHTVKALANQLGKPCLYVKGFKSEYATDQENMRLVFARARITTPCLLVLEDLDSLIDDKSRAFLLNELDGFETNTGVVVLATTNHPDRLDPAILDRPSRFDRKYCFDLPAEAERFAYIAAWNQELQAELRLSEQIAAKVVDQTEGFSFAYLKELFLSSMMQWMARAASIPMDEIVLGQTAQLREQTAANQAIHCLPIKDQPGALRLS